MIISGAVPEALRAWLRARPPAAAGNRRSWFKSGLVLLAVGAGLAWLVDPMLALIAALGRQELPWQRSSWIRVLLQMAMKRLQRANLRPGIHSRIWGSKAPRHGIFLRLQPVCANWRAKWPSCDASIIRARYREGDRESLKNDLEGLSEPGIDLDARRQELKERLGLDALPPDAELVDFARALDHLRSARASHEAAIGKVKQLEAKTCGTSGRSCRNPETSRRTAARETPPRPRPALTIWLRGMGCWRKPMEKKG